MNFVDAQIRSAAMFSSPEFVKRVTDEDPNMLNYLPLLASINQHGYITTNSQAGLKTENDSYEIVERAYIVGFMLEKKAVDFIQTISIMTDKNAIYIPFSDNVYAPPNLDVPLSITKKNGDTFVHTHMSTILPTSVWEQERKEARIHRREKIVYVFCWDTQWHRRAGLPRGLFTDVLKILSDIK